MAISSEGQSLLGWVVAFTVVSTLAMVGRFWAAIITRRQFFLDDALVLVAYAWTIACEGISIWGLENGLGKRMTELTPAQLKVQYQIILYASVTWIMGTAFIKLAVLQLYTRIFTTRTFKRAARGLMVVSACYGIAFLVLFITHCDPVDFMWNPTPDGSCREITHEEITSGALNIVIDTAIIALPMPWLWKLQLPMRNKVFLTILFAIGSLTLAVMCYRLYETVHSNPDPIRALAEVGLLSSIELFLGIIVACMPTMAPIFINYVKPVISKLSSLSGRSSRQSTDQAALPRHHNGGVNTIGGSGPSKGSRKNYHDLEKSYTQMDRDSGELPLVAEPGIVHTNIEHNRLDSPPSQEGIYVQHQFHSQDVHDRV